MPKTATTPSTEAPPKPRKPRENAEILLQSEADVSASGMLTPKFIDLPVGPFDGVDAALAHIRKGDGEGRYRIIAVKRIVTATKEQKTVIKLT